MRGIVLQGRIDVAVECGTWYGGGSTLVMAKAMQEVNRGALWTWEMDPTVFGEATSTFNREFPELKPRVHFHLGDFITGVRQDGVPKAIDMAFMDGPEDAAYSLWAFRAIERRIRAGGVAAFHDWKTEKCRLIRDYLASDPAWKLECSLDTATGLAYVTRL